MTSEIRSLFESIVAKPPMGCRWSEEEQRYTHYKYENGRRTAERYNRDYRIFCEGHNQGQKSMLGGER